MSFNVKPGINRNNWWLLLLIPGTISVILAGLAFVWIAPSFNDSLSIPSVVTVKEREIARRSFEKQYGRAPNRDDILSWMAEWYLARKRLGDAVICFAEIPTAHPKYGRMARFQQGRTLLTLHRAIEAEQQFHELITAEEQEPAIEPRYLFDARQRLRHILEVELRFEERQSLLRGVVARGEADHFEIVAYCFPTQLRWNGPQATEWVEEFYAVDSTHPMIRIAKGRYLTGQGKLPDARTLLAAVVQEFPTDLRGMAAFIACLREADASEEVDRLMADLPPQSPDDSWLLLLQRGDHALQNGNSQAAVLAYEQVLRTDRTSGAAWQGLINATRLSGDAARRAEAIQMAAGLGRIQSHLGKGIQRPSDPNSFLDVADLCAEIGLDREGLILTQYALKLASQNQRALNAAKMFKLRLAEPKSGRSVGK
jgi:tetratricopeptide (TPR) repeat protein